VWATLVAMTANFAINNIVTYRDMALKGWAWVRGWFSFVLACSVGAAANVGVATWLFEQESAWFVAGFAGILVGAVWNYSVTRTYTWRADGG
jgi:dolichol-phosphate mannosyltransferase